MTSFFLTKRKTLELALLIALDLVLYVIFGSFDFVILFSFGYVWNWVGSQHESLSFEGRKYRYSTLKTVINLQNLFLKPIMGAPHFIKMLVRSLPAGLFWGGVILFVDSHMPWWAVFIGSFTLEIILLEKRILIPPPHSST